MTEKTTTASFGREDVPIDEKQKRVHRVFESVADKYDVMNDLMSGGLHRVWKQHMVNSLALPTGNRDFHLLDVAGGTGDIAFKADAQAGNGFAATILDINEAMLQAGQARLEKKKIYLTQKKLILLSVMPKHLPYLMGSLTLTQLLSALETSHIATRH